jgi:hypothetical protein
VAGALVAVAAGVAGCGRQATSGAELSAGVEQYREDEVAGRLQVRMLATGSRPVSVSAVAVEWPGLRTEPADIDTELRPGIAADLPVTLGEAVCGPLPESLTTDPGPPPAAEPTAIVTADGEERRVLIVDRDGVLGRIWRRDCRRQQIAERVSVRFAEEWTRVEGAPGAPSARGQLIVEPSRGTAAVSELRGTVIAALRTEIPLPAVAPVRLPVTVATNGRCTGHVLGEVKKPFDFAVGLTVDGVEVTAAPVRPDQASQQLLREVVEDGCALLAPAG